MIALNFKETKSFFYLNTYKEKSKVTTFKIVSVFLVKYMSEGILGIIFIKYEAMCH